MNNSSFPFVIFHCSRDEQTRLVAALGACPFPLVKWLYTIEVFPERLSLIYNLHYPSRKEIDEDMLPHLRAKGFAQELTLNHQRPAKLHETAQNRLSEIRILIEQNQDNLTWITKEVLPVLRYLAHYHFLHLTPDHQVDGSKGLNCMPSDKQEASWISGVKMTGADGEQFLLKWSEDENIT